MMSMKDSGPADDVAASGAPGVSVQDSPLDPRGVSVSNLIGKPWFMIMNAEPEPVEYTTPTWLDIIHDAVWIPVDEDDYIVLGEN
jgi:hypothetical protein